MTALTSYLRHLIVVGVLYLVSRYELPLAGAEEAANALALLGIGTLTWAVVKYLPAFAKSIGLLALLVMVLPGCAEFPVTASIEGPDGVVSYSAKGGLVLAARIYADK